jgi:hypothetical protein
LFRGIPLGTAAAPSIAIEGDENTGIYSPGADQVAISTNAVERVEFGTSEVVFNDGGANYDFRIEGDTDANLFFVDASTDRVGLGTSSPSATLDVRGSVGVGVPPNGSWGTQVIGFGKDGASNPTYPFIASTTSQDLQIGSNARWDGTNWKYQFSAAAITAARMEVGYNQIGFYRAVSGAAGNNITWLPSLFINDSGNVGIGTTSPGKRLEVRPGSSGDGVLIANGGYQTFGSNATLYLSGGVNNNGDFAGFAIASEQTSAAQHVLKFCRATANADNTNFAVSTEYARIDNSGRLLVGTSTARSNFFNGSVTAGLQAESTGEGSIVAAIRNVNDAAVVPVFLLAKSRGGSVGSNTIVSSGDSLGYLSYQGSDGSEFVEAARISGEVDGTPGANDMPGRLVFSTTADGASSPTERMRIDNAGITMIGGGAAETNGSITIYPNNSNGGAQAVWNRASTTGGTTAFNFKNGGTQVGTVVYSNTATAYNTSSDYRLKENVVPLTGAIDRLNELQVYRFNFIADPDKAVDGFIAHEAQVVVPECVTGTKDEVDADGNPVYQGIDQSKLVPLLTAALQEALAKIETLEARLTAAGI